MPKRIPQEFLDQLLARTDIVEMIDHVVPLKKNGANFAACCPFHSEKTPSFTVSPTKQFYHCFGCGAHGNAISFLMEHERLNFLEAVETLARQAGLEIPQQAPKEEKSFTPLYDALDFAAQFYQQQLKHSDDAIQYFKKRCLSGEIAKEYGLGFAKNTWDNLLNASLAEGFSENQLLEAGLIIRNEDGKCYDRFRNRVMFPIRDRRGRVIGFGGRVMDDSLPKYLNSPETPVFHKGQELYGLWEARKKERHLSRIIIVEGYMDVLALAEHGIHEAIATLGTATTASHLQLLFRQSKDIIFCFDGDEAGMKAAKRALDIALPVLQDDVTVRFLFLPQGEDPDSLIQREGKELFLQRAKTATTLADFLLQNLGANYDLQTIDGRANLASAAMNQINRIPEGMLKQLLSTELANIVRMDIAPPVSASPKTVVSKTPSKTLVKPRSMMRNAMVLLVQNPELAKTLSATTASFTLPGGELFLELIALLQKHPGLSTAALLERFRDSTHYTLLAKLASETHSAPPDGIQHEFEGTIKRLLSEQRAIDIDNLMAKAAIPPGLSQEEKQKLQTLIKTQNVAAQKA